MLAVFVPFVQAEEVSPQKVRALMTLQMQKFLAVGSPPRHIQNICYYEKQGVPIAESVGQIIEAYIKANAAKLALRVTRYDAIEGFDECDLLYIPTAEENNLDNILAATAGKPIVTMSAVKRFIYHGGMLGFVMDNQSRVKVEASTKNMKNNNVQIDPQLLEIMLHVEN